MTCQTMRSRSQGSHCHRISRVIVIKGINYQERLANLAPGLGRVYLIKSMENHRMNIRIDTRTSIVFQLKLC